MQLEKHARRCATAAQNFVTKKIPDPVRAYLAAIGKKGGRVGGKSKSAAKLAALAENRNTAGRPKGAKDKQPRKPRKKAL